MHGYFPLNKRLTDLSVLSLTAAWAAGAIVSSADDVARFYRALLQGRLLRADLLREMETTVPMGLASNDYGLGLWRTGTIALTSTPFPAAPPGATTATGSATTPTPSTARTARASSSCSSTATRRRSRRRSRQAIFGVGSEGVLLNKRRAAGQPSGALLVGGLRSRGSLDAVTAREP